MDMTNEILEQEQKQTIETEIVPALQKARSLVVKNHDHRFEAVGFVKSLKAMKEKIEERFHPTQNKERAYEVYKDLVETEHAFYDPIDEALKVTNGTVKTFDTQEAIKIQRQAQEDKAKRQKAEREECERLEAKAMKEAEKGNTEKAEVLLQQAETVTVAPSFTPPPQPAKKLIWKCKVTNLFALCQAIATGQVPFSVVEVRQSALNDFSKNYDGKTKINGIEFYQEAITRI
jgi:hypothetical protein